MARFWPKTNIQSGSGITWPINFTPAIQPPEGPGAVHEDVIRESRTVCSRNPRFTDTTQDVEKAHVFAYSEEIPRRGRKLQPQKRITQVKSVNLGFDSSQFLRDPIAGHTMNLDYVGGIGESSSLVFRPGDRGVLGPPIRLDANDARWRLDQRSPNSVINLSIVTHWGDINAG